jgi:hypothetical protein
MESGFSVWEPTQSKVVVYSNRGLSEFIIVFQLNTKNELA